MYAHYFKQNIHIECILHQSACMQHSIDKYLKKHSVKMHAKQQWPLKTVVINTFGHMTGRVHRGNLPLWSFYIDNGVPAS